MQTVQLIP